MKPLIKPLKLFIESLEPLLETFKTFYKKSFKHFYKQISENLIKSLQNLFEKSSKNLYKTSKPLKNL